MVGDCSMSVSNISFKTSDSDLQTSIVPSQNDPTVSKIEEKTQPIFRVLAFLAGLAIPAAGAAFVAFAIASGSVIILLIPIVVSFSLFSIPLIGFAVFGRYEYPVNAPAESDRRSDMIDMRLGYSSYY
jgi:hypothetical protein